MKLRAVREKEPCLPSDQTRPSGFAPARALASMTGKASTPEIPWSRKGLGEVVPLGVRLGAPEHEGFGDVPGPDLRPLSEVGQGPGQPE